MAIGRSWFGYSGFHVYIQSELKRCLRSEAELEILYPSMQLFDMDRYITAALPLPNVKSVDSGPV